MSSLAGGYPGPPVSRPTARAVAGPVPVGPGSPAHLTGAQGLVREPSPGRPPLLEDGLSSGSRCRLLGVFAHPDDETFCAGGTFARYAGQGAEIIAVSATRGQAGQIRDAAAGSRRTIASVREAELRLACERLGITTVRCLDHVDSTLADAEFPALVDEVAEAISEFRPDVVITFAPDGGYGHPDHITIGAVTTAACQRAAGPGHRPDTGPLRRPPRLYYRCFPPGDLLIAERLATWLTSQPNRFAGTSAFAYALLLLSEAASTMRHVRDHVQVRWYPSGSYVIEQGEVAAELFLILSGEAEVWQESSGGHREQLRRLGVGEFFGHRHCSADVVAAGSLTCLVLSAAPPTKFAGRGRGARLAGAAPGARADASPAAGHVRPGQGVVSCDVSGQVMRKVDALPPTAASSRWSRACSRSSCYGRCSAANTSWPPLLLGPLIWTRCRRCPCLSRS